MSLFAKKPSTAPANPASLKESASLLEAEKAYRHGLVTIYDLIAQAAMKVDTTHLELGGKFVRTLFVVEYPRYIAIGWFALIINLSSELDISMFFYPLDAAIVLKQLRNRVGNLQAQLSAASEKGAPRDPMVETALRDMEKLRD